MKTSLIKILKFIGFLLLGITLLYFAFKGIDFDSLMEDFKHAQYRWVILSLCFALVAYFSRAARWKLIIEPLNYNPSFANTFYSMMVGYLANFAFPRIGEITRCATLGKKEKIPVDRLIGTVIVERAVDLISLIIILIVLFIFRFQTFGSFFRESVFIPLGDKISSSLNFSWIIWIVLAILSLLAVSLYFLFRRRLSEIKMVSKTKDIMRGVVEGLKSVYKMKKRWQFILHTIFIWMNYWMMTWIVVFAIPATSNLGIIDGLFILAIGGLGMSAPVQGGIGAFHWIVSRGLSTVFTGISVEEGLVFATISHESQAILAIALGTLSLILLFRNKKAKKVIRDILPKSKEAGEISA